MVNKSTDTKPIATSIEQEEALSPIRHKPLVFISHDNRDADIAEAFSNLLIDVS